MQRWQLVIEYDGRPFNGWQKQEAHILTVQGVLESALQKFCGEAVTLGVAGRTDTGVHATGQVAHVDLARTTTADEIMGALNFHVKPHPIAVLSALPVAADFHARLSARQRHYAYRVVNRRAPLALDIGRAWHVPAPLDAAAMQQAASLLLGQHDFSTFRAQGCQAQSPVKTIERCEFLRAGDELHLHISAKSFLYHQVRNIIGSLVKVGLGQWQVADFAAALAAKDRAAGGPTAPPDGLYFLRVDY